MRIPTVPSTPRTIITPEQFSAIYNALPDADAQLLVETAIESGLRWGELTELRVRDLDLATRMLTVSRKVIELNREFHPDGKRFLVRHYPKDKEYRRLKLSQQIVAKIKAHITAQNLGPDSLLFARRAAPPAEPGTVPEPGTLGLTAPSDTGHRYRHGTLSAYNAGRCRCEHCRGAFAQYRAQRRAASGASPQLPRLPDDEHIGRNVFRRGIWHPACEAADLGIRPRVHDLRHAHASWLLAGGADLQVVKERLGHASIMTTQRYLHLAGRRRDRGRGIEQDPQPEPGQDSMNPRTRRAARYAIGVIAILASVNALAHSYAGLYDWAVHHRLTGWQAMSWPAEIDVFLAVGELTLYVA